MGTHLTMAVCPLASKLQPQAPPICGNIKREIAYYISVDLVDLGVLSALFSDKAIVLNQI